MASTHIRISDNGPLVIRGGITVVDADGRPFDARETVALCRCGHSGSKPFCDGSHAREGFQSAPRASAPSGDAP